MCSPSLNCPKFYIMKQILFSKIIIGIFLDQLLLPHKFYRVACHFLTVIPMWDFSFLGKGGVQKWGFPLDTNQGSPTPQCTVHTWHATRVFLTFFFFGYIFLGMFLLHMWSSESVLSSSPVTVNMLCP